MLLRLTPYHDILTTIFIIATKFQAIANKFYEAYRSNICYNHNNRLPLSREKLWYRA